MRYAGWYSNRSRGKRARSGTASIEAEDCALHDEIADAIRARSTWARLIHKVYEVDPLVCTKCNGPMRVIAFIDEPDVVQRILEHLHLWSPVEKYEPARGPPAPAPCCREAEPPLVFTYHPVPDIA